jgi:hypothetical protein
MIQCDACHVTLAGVFDLPAAQQISEAVRDLPAGGHVSVDFSQVSGIQDCSLALLARALRGPCGALCIRVHGLLDHQIRLLRYMGLAVETPPPDEELN